MLCIVNQRRQEHGLPALGPSTALDHCAQEHSRYQADIQVMTHNDKYRRSLGSRVEQKGYNGWRGVAENVAYGQDSEEEVMEQWMNSPGHRHNILGDYTHLGSAVALTRDGVAYYTQDFASDGKRHQFAVCGPSSSYGGDNDNDSDDSDDGDYQPKRSTRHRKTTTPRPAKRQSKHSNRQPRKIIRVIHRWVQHSKPKPSKQKQQQDEPCDDDDDDKDQAKS
jgi:hypothetical protein